MNVRREHANCRGPQPEGELTLRSEIKDAFGCLKQFTGDAFINEVMEWQEPFKRHMKMVYQAIDAETSAEKSYLCLQKHLCGQTEVSEDNNLFVATRMNELIEVRHRAIEERFVRPLRRVWFQPRVLFSPPHHQSHN